MKVHAVVAVYGGVVNDVLVFSDLEEAKKLKRSLLKQHGFDANDDDIVIFDSIEVQERF